MRSAPPRAAITGDGRPAAGRRSAARPRPPGGRLVALPPLPTTLASPGLRHPLPGEGHKEMKKRVAEEKKSGVQKVIGVSKLKSKYSVYEARRNLVNSYDIFLADERIVRRIRRNMKKLEDCEFIANYYLESVRWQHEEYNAPTCAHADWVIPGGMADAREREEAVAAICQAIAQVSAGR